MTLSDTLAAASLSLAALAVLLSWRMWRYQFRPIVAVMVETHAGGNTAIAYDLVLLNCGQLPAQNIRLSCNPSSLATALADGATSDEKSKYLACFSPDCKILALNNGASTRCSFGMTGAGSNSFWNYGAEFEIELRYESWFGTKYTERQMVKIQDSLGFTGFYWG